MKKLILFFILSLSFASAQDHRYHKIIHYTRHSLNLQSHTLSFFYNPVELQYQQLFLSAGYGANKLSLHYLFNLDHMGKANNRLYFNQGNTFSSLYQLSSLWSFYAMTDFHFSSLYNRIMLFNGNITAFLNKDKWAIHGGTLLWQRNAGFEAGIKYRVFNNQSGSLLGYVQINQLIFHPMRGEGGIEFRKTDYFSMSSSAGFDSRSFFAFFRLTPEFKKSSIVIYLPLSLEYYSAFGLRGNGGVVISF